MGWSRQSWRIWEEREGWQRVDIKANVNSIGVTERDEARGLAPATAAIWTGLSDFINRDEAVSLLEQGFGFIHISFFLGHLGKSTTLNILLKVETRNSNFGETFNSVS